MTREWKWEVISNLFFYHVSEFIDDFMMITILFHRKKNIKEDYYIIISVFLSFGFLPDSVHMALL